MTKRKIWPFRRVRAAWSDESGQALIELALTVPFLAIILLGAAEIARLAYAGIEVSNAAKAGAQYGGEGNAQAGDTQGIQNAAAAEAANLTGILTTSAIVNSCSDGSVYSSSTNCPNGFTESTLTVNTSLSYDPLIHIKGLPNSITLKGQAVQKVGD